MTEQEPIDVGSEKQLFCDGLIIGEIRSLERTLEFCAKGNSVPQKRETGP